MKRIICTFLAVFLLVLGCAGCQPTGGNDPTPEPTPTPTPIPDDPSPDDESTVQKPEQLLAAMTLEEKIGQLFIIRPESLDSTLTPEQVHSTRDYGVQALTEEMAAQLSKYPAGGIVFFGKNIAGPEQLEAFLSGLKQASDLPLMICTDEEGGSVSRIANAAGFQVQKFDGAEAIGATGDPHEAYHMGQVIGAYLNRYGFNLDFAPVADINSDLEHIIIGPRAFGSDAQTVSSMVNAMIDGLHDGGVMACIKHFPGHGAASGDSHDGYVELDKSWEELLQCELIPFIGALEKTDLVMAAHIATPNVTNDGLPASLSHTMLTEKLRGELGYDGVIITDALAMIDIDNLKQINDRFGHPAGDTAIYHTAQAIRAILRSQDELVRYGGDEFLLLFHSLPQNILRRKLEDICRAVRALRVADLPELRITVSIGGVYAAGQISELVEKADLALYRAKAQKDRAVLYEEDFHDSE